MAKDLAWWRGASDGRYPPRFLTEHATKPRRQRYVRHAVYLMDRAVNNATSRGVPPPSRLRRPRRLRSLRSSRIGRGPSTIPPKSPRTPGPRPGFFCPIPPAPQYPTLLPSHVHDRLNSRNQFLRSHSAYIQLLRLHPLFRFVPNINHLFSQSRRQTEPYLNATVSVYLNPLPVR